MTTIELDMYLKMYFIPIKSLYLSCERKVIFSFTLKISFEIFIRTYQ